MFWNFLCVKISAALFFFSDLEKKEESVSFVTLTMIFPTFYDARIVVVSVREVDFLASLYLSSRSKTENYSIKNSSGVCQMASAP